MRTLACTDLEYRFQVAISQLLEARRLKFGGRPFSFLSPPMSHRRIGLDTRAFLTASLGDTAFDSDPVEGGKLQQKLSS